jgi:hypothetical protein
MEILLEYLTHHASAVFKSNRVDSKMITIYNQMKGGCSINMYLVIHINKAKNKQEEMWKPYLNFQQQLAIQHEHLYDEFFHSPRKRSSYLRLSCLFLKR